MKKKIQDPVKIFVENLLSSKPIEFFSCGIIKLPDEWKEVI